MYICVITGCTELQVRHNTVAGATLAGYFVPGVACTERTGQTQFLDNYAHSILGNGVFVVENLGLSNPLVCQGVYDFRAFRTSEQSAFVFRQFEGFEMRNITSIDCHYGPTPYVVPANDKADIVLSDIWTHGEHPDAPQDNCPERIMGFLTPVSVSATQSIPIDRPPHDKLFIKTAEMWGTIRATDIHFDRFL